MIGSNRRIGSRLRSGFTAVELAIAMTILIVLLAGVATVQQRSVALFEQTLVNDRVDAATSRAIARMTAELSSAGFGTLWPDATTDWGTETLDFQTVVGSVGSVPTFSPVLRYAFEFAPGEVENGVDDNGDGLVDEGRVVRIEDPDTPDEKRAVLVNGVAPYQPREVANGLDDNGNGLRDERGLSFQVTGRELTIRLCLMRVGPDGRPVTRMLETSQALRN